VGKFIFLCFCSVRNGKVEKKPVRFEIIVRMSLSSHVTSRDQKNGFALNLVLKIFAKICRHVSILVKVGKIVVTSHKDLHEFLVASLSKF
jgi:hypothetical protein